MASEGDFIIFQRSDGSQVVCQRSKILYVTRGEHVTVLHFGGGTQVNLRDEFDEVLAKLGVE